MAEITTELIKELREKTNVSIMQCKKALEETGGNIDEAVLVLRKISGEVASKKQDRETSAGVIAIKDTGNKAFMITLNCETDFVAQNDDFKSGIATLLDIYAEKGEDALVAEAEQIVKSLVLKIGENINLGERFSIEGDTIGTYLHHNGKTGTLVSLSGGDKDLAKDISMHIAAMNPKYISANDVPEGEMNTTKEFFKKEVDETSGDKPAEIKEKMLTGKIDSYLKDITLLKQPFFKDESVSIEKLLASKNATVLDFKRIRII